MSPVDMLCTCISGSYIKDTSVFVRICTSYVVGMSVVVGVNVVYDCGFFFK